MRSYVISNICDKWKVRSSFGTFPLVCLLSVYFISSSVTLNKLYYTHSYLAASFGSVNSHHQAIKNTVKMETL
jgi:hypothetical protein